jgi:hypothetical protein
MDGAAMGNDQPPEPAAQLRLATSLAQLPSRRPLPTPASMQGMAAMFREANSTNPPGLLLLTAGLGAISVLTSVGWLIERRRRRTEEDSILWADVQPQASSMGATKGSLDDILREGRTPAESARAIYVTAIGETTSRREATLIDLHELDDKLQRRLKRGDQNAAVLLLQQHLVDFRYTSPWVFLELRELYLDLNLQKEWEVAREAFRVRFGQNAPLWISLSTASAQLEDDTQLCEGLSSLWPNRPARMWMLRWLLGEHDMRVKAMGPALLPLGVYRDLMVVDRLLDDIMPQTTAYQDTL